LVHGSGHEADHPIVPEFELYEESHGKVQGGASGFAVFNDDGEKPCIGKRGETLSDKMLTRPLVLGPVLDAPCFLVRNGYLWVMIRIEGMDCVVKL
jgi:hypothetical protein